MARPGDPDVCLLRALRGGGNAPGGDDQAPAGFVSGPALQAAAGLADPDALAARLAGLRAAGYVLEERPGHGWRLAAAPERLVADDILAALAAAAASGDAGRAALEAVAREIIVFEETGSTNDLAARVGDDGAAGGLVFFAEAQRAGRGQAGRRWESRPRCGLWFSVLLRPGAWGVPAARWPELTFCAALAVAEAAERFTGRTARVKWPNDVYVAGRKVAGILLECHHRREPGAVVVGIGLNVRQTAEDFAPELRATAGSLAMLAPLGGPPLERPAVAAAVLARLAAHAAAWPADFDAVFAACAARGCVQPAAVAETTAASGQQKSGPREGAAP